MKILVDGDSCSQKAAIVKLARKHSIPVHIYKDSNHEIDDDYAEIHTVDDGSNSADLLIANKVEPNDIVVTNDAGLALLVLARHGLPISCKGVIYTNKNINKHINRRHMMSSAHRKSRNRTHRTNMPSCAEQHPPFYASLRYLIKRVEKKNFTAIKEEM